MRQLNLGELRSHGLQSVGLDPDIYSIESAEFVAALLRRAASSMCPCTSSELIRTVCSSIVPILDLSIDDFEQLTRQVLESLIGNGDLVEEQEAEISSRADLKGRVLYLRPPSFIQRDNGSVFLVGIASGNANVFSPQLEERIHYFSHLRRLDARMDEDLPTILKSVGLTELSVEGWDRRNMIPETERAADFINKMKLKLQSNPGALEGLEILTPDSDVRYYRRRWKTLSRQTGCFVARRPQLFGNNLWCYVEIQNGTPKRMTDLPVLDKNSLGRDEAWRLQMAIDADCGNPQEFTVIRLEDGNVKVKFYSPIPSWAQRRWDNLGEPAGNDGCLFSYNFVASDLPQEVDFMNKKLWLIEKS